MPIHTHPNIAPGPCNHGVQREWDEMESRGETEVVEEGRLGGEDHPSTAPSPRCRQLCAVDRAASRENLLLHAEKRAGIREYPTSWRKRIIQEIPSFLIRDTVIAFNSFRFGWNGKRKNRGSKSEERLLKCCNPSQNVRNNVIETPSKIQR